MAALADMSRTERFQYIADTMPALSKAGAVHQADGENVAQSLSYSRDPRNNARPPTPPEIKKYRRSFKQQPGLRLIHVGGVGDTLPLGKDFRYGMTTDLGKNTVAHCVNPVPLSKLQDYSNAVKEREYQSNVREPLGASYKRGHKLPAHTTTPEFAFGITSDSSEKVANLIYYDAYNDAQKKVKQARSVDVTEVHYLPERDITRQINRQYNWEAAGIDPSTHRFGRRPPNGVHEGVKKSLTTETADVTIGLRRQQQVKGVFQDRLGRGREARGYLRNLGDDFVFGHTSNNNDWTVKKLILGDYDLVDQLPDADLGISTRKLSQLEQVPPNLQDRPYGIPSIRRDLAPPVLRSVADPLNYGNEGGAQGLLNPGRFAYDGVDDEDFVAVRSRNEVRDIFKRIGAVFLEPQFQRLCDKAESDFGGLSADSFRHAWNKERMEATLSPLKC